MNKDRPLQVMRLGELSVYFKSASLTTHIVMSCVPSDAWSNADKNTHLALLLKIFSVVSVTLVLKNERNVFANRKNDVFQIIMQKGSYKATLSIYTNSCLILIFVIYQGKSSCSFDEIVFNVN